MELIGILINLRINQKKEVKANETTPNHNRSRGAWWGVGRDRQSSQYVRLLESEISKLTNSTWLLAKCECEDWAEFFHSV